MGTGTLYVVATPIGNLEDVTLRALRVLREVDLIAAEDTRRTRTLLERHGIARPLTSYYDAVERQRAPALIERLRAGAAVALVSDAGTPGIADPGYHLVRGALAAGIAVVPVPGPATAFLNKIQGEELRVGVHVARTARRCRVLRPPIARARAGAAPVCRAADRLS